MEGKRVGFGQNYGKFQTDSVLTTCKEMKEAVAVLRPNNLKFFSHRSCRLLMGTEWIKMLRPWVTSLL